MVKIAYDNPVILYNLDCCEYYSVTKDLLSISTTGV